MGALELTYLSRWSVWYLEYKPRLGLSSYSRYQISTSWSDDILYVGYSTCTCSCAWTCTKNVRVCDATRFGRWETFCFSCSGLHHRHMHLACFWSGNAASPFWKHTTTPTISAAKWAASDKTLNIGKPVAMVTTSPPIQTTAAPTTQPPMQTTNAMTTPPQQQTTPPLQQVSWQCKGSSVIFEFFLNPYSQRKGGRGVLAKYELEKVWLAYESMCIHCNARSRHESRRARSSSWRSIYTRSELSFSKRSFYF